MTRAVSHAFTAVVVGVSPDSYRRKERGLIWWALWVYAIACWATLAWMWLS